MKHHTTLHIFDRNNLFWVEAVNIFAVALSVCIAFANWTFRNALKHWKNILLYLLKRYLSTYVVVPLKQQFYVIS